jgi:cysteine desulfurase
MEAQMHGGGHERGMRSGTLATHQIVGMGEAFRLAKLEMGQPTVPRHPPRCVSACSTGLMHDRARSILNGDPPASGCRTTLNVSFNFIEGESLMMGDQGAWRSPVRFGLHLGQSLEPSYVLRALGLSDELAHSSLRMTIGRFTTEEEIDYAISTIRQNVAKLRDLSPLWEMYQDGIDISTIQWTAH